MKNPQESNPSINTKNRLIEVALELFALYGYEGVSTRKIVEKADVNISAINYYFGGKEGLYKAAIESKIELFELKMNDLLNEISNKKHTDKKEQKKFLIELLNRYMDLILSKGLPQYLVLLLIREMTNPSSVFDIFYNRIMGRVHKAFTSLIASIFDKPEDDESMVILATTIIGQMLIFRFGKRVILKRLDLDEYNPDLLNQIKNTVLKQTEITINNWSLL